MATTTDISPQVNSRKMCNNPTGLFNDKQCIVIWKVTSNKLNFAGSNSTKAIRSPSLNMWKSLSTNWQMKSARTSLNIKMVVQNNFQSQEPTLHGKFVELKSSIYNFSNDWLFNIVWKKVMEKAGTHNNIWEER